eukprot:jgi/Ulvmu1/9397/UM051_0025.1
MQAFSGLDAVLALKHRISPAMLTPDTQLRSCGSGVQLRGGRGNGKRDPAFTRTNGVTPATHANNAAAAAFPQPACQPMPVHVLVHLLEHLSSHRPPAKDSRAILHALHDYIGDAISQPGLSPASQSSNDFDSVLAASSPLSWAPAAHAVHASAPSHDAPPNGTPATPAPGTPANGSVTSPQSKAPSGSFTVDPPAEGSGGGAAPMSQSPAPASSTLQDHIMRWSADLGILQAMYSAGFSEGEVEAFVTKLLPGLAEGVKSQLSQAGVQLGGLAGGAPAPPAPAASASELESLSAAIPERLSAVARDLPPLVSGTAATTEQGEAAAAAEDAAAGSSGGELPATAVVPLLPPLPAAVGGARVTDRVSPFIQRPYHLLQQLHEHAKTRGGGSVSGGSSGSASGRAASDIDSASSFSKPCAMPLKSGGPPSSLPVSPAASKPGSTSASPTSTPQDPTDASEDSGSIFAGPGKLSGDADSGEATAGVRTPPASGSAIACKQGSFDSPIRSDADRAGAAVGAGAPQPVSAGWKSVLDMLISAGPQAVQPAASYVPSYAWGSGNSSTEPDTFSAKSEDPVNGGSGSGDGSGPPPAAASAATGKAKKRRNKRSKNGARSGA